MTDAEGTRFVVGRRYRITYLPTNARTKVQTVEVNYLGSEADHTIIVDGRPEFGTSNLRREQLREVEDIGPAIWDRR